MTSIPRFFRPLFIAAAIAAHPSVASAADYTVDFEGAGETKAGYASGSVTLSGLDWNLTEALIGDLPADWKNGLRSARLRGYTASTMTMSADKSDGAGVISFSYRRYGTDAQIPWAVESSTNGGSTWSQVGTDFTGSDLVQTFNETVNASGNVRIRIIAKVTSTANRRLNIDDITITDNSGPDTSPPVVSSLSPADDAPAAPLGADLVLTFNEPVQAGTGAVRLFSGATEVESFTVTAGNISGNSATFNPAADLIPGTAYHVKIDAGAIKDMAGNEFAGIADDTTWNFTALTPTPPDIATLLPADNATGVATSTSLMITFDEPVRAGAGSVYLYDGATLVESFPVSVGFVSGSSATFYPTVGLLSGTVYHVKIDAGAFEDLEGTAFAGISDDSTWNFTTAGGVDTDPPAVDSFNPAHNSSGVSVTTSLAITFNEAVDFGGDGYLRLYVLGNPTPVTTLFVDEASIDGATVTFFTGATLAFETTYYVTLDGGTFQDFAGNPFPGISGDSTWRFTTMVPDTTPPSAIAENPVTPAHGATRVQLNATLSITFDEAIQAGAGDILIKNAADHAVVAQIAANSAQVAISSATATITPPAGLLPNATLFVEVPAGAFKDLAGNNSNAYGGSGVWSFTTVTLPELTASGAYTQGFASFTSTEPLTDAHVIMPDGWTSTGPLLGYVGDFGTSTTGGFRGTGVLGYQHSASSNTLVKTLTLVNGTGSTLTALTVSYTGRTATVGTQNRYPAYTVVVAGVTAPALAYSTQDGDNLVRTASVTGLFVAPGAQFTVNWTSDKDGPGSGASRQIGLTAVSVAAGAVEMPPVVAPVAVTSGTLTHTSVAVTSEVIADGGAALTSRGFVYAKAADNSAPEIGGTGVSQATDAANTVGPMGATLSGLEPATQYAVRSYATNAVGTAYSAALTFATLQPPLALVTSYSQNFAGFTSPVNLEDGRPLLPNGWTVTGIDFSFDGDFGTGFNGGFRGNEQVLGYQHTSNTGVLTVSLRLLNDTGATIESLWVSYLGRVARAAEGRSPAWTVALNGSEIPELGYSTAAGTDQLRTRQLTGLAIAPGQVFTLSWSSDRAAGSGSSRQIGIADFYVGLTEPVGGYNGWAAANAGGGEPGADFDGDGVPNGIEYFMNITTPGFTKNPGLVGGTVSWINGGNLPPSAYGTKFRVETSANLVQWDAVLATDPKLQNLTGLLSYSLNPMTGKSFVRLVVTP